VDQDALVISWLPFKDDASQALLQRHLVSIWGARAVPITYLRQKVFGGSFSIDIF
jgi:hypothetical protein